MRVDGPFSRLSSAVAGVAVAAVTAAALSASEAPAQAQGAPVTLTAYTSLQKEVLAPYEAAFRKAHPEIQIAWVRDAGGVIHSRLLAERANPRADIIFGLPVTDIVGLYNEGLTEPYAPKGYEALKPRFRDQRNPPAWTGLEMYLNVICFNTVEAKRRNLPVPKTWSDLQNPVYRGQIAMPSPAMSNTGYGYVQSWVQEMGEAPAWAFMDALDKNVAIYTSSSATPCKLASQGEYALGLSTDLTGPMLKTKGAPIDLVIPDDKTAWDVESVALPKGSRHPDAAKTMIDWSVSKEASEVFNKYYGIVGVPGLNNGPENSVPDGDTHAANYSIDWAITNRDRILAEWTKRYEAKSEK
jgi:iron(III) transport system substrate-binding protein